MGSIILLITHRLSLAKQSSKIYLLEEKTIRRSGGHEELIGKDNIYSQAYKSITSNQVLN
ncbi:MAG: hypothetical protein RIC06_20905 [Cyclobacteriaceae bacterium]